MWKLTWQAVPNDFCNLQNVCQVFLIGLNHILEMLRILLAGISDLLSVDIPLGTIFSYQTAVDQVEVRDGIESEIDN